MKHANDNFKIYEPWKNEFLPGTEYHKAFDRFRYAHDQQKKAIMQISFGFVQEHGEDVVLDALNTLHSFSNLPPLPCYINSMIPASDIFGKYGLTKEEYLENRKDDVEWFLQN